MFKDPFVKQTIKMLALFVASIGLCLVTKGFFIGIIILAGCAFIAQRKTGASIVCFLLLPMLNSLNRSLIGSSSYFILLGKVGMVILALIFVITASSRRFREKLPIGFIWAYLIVALVSSIEGWMPLISYLKIINFSLLLIGVVGSVKLMQYRQTDINQPRSIFMAFCILIVVGSVALYFVPSIGYSNEIASFARYGMYVDASDLKYNDYKLLFNGMTYHSQALGPLVGLCFMWVICDMLFAEHRMSVMHLAVLLLAPILMYGSRSRTALVAVAFPMAYLYFICIPRSALSRKVKRRMTCLFTLLCVAFVGAAVFMEIQNRTISKWLRKTDDVEGDTRTLGEAITASRQGGIAEDMYDFNLNPLWGKGFQVASWHKQAYETGRISLLSAPIEKGNLWVMVLGEGGIIGFTVFMLFMFSFYAICFKRRYAATGTLMTSFFAANLGEAMFFSPSAMGGIGWVLAGVGGMAIDLMAEKRRVMECNGYLWHG